MEENKMPKRQLSWLILPVFLLVFLPAPAGAEDLNAALLAASLQGDAAKVQELISRGADVNATDPDGRTPLLNAVEKGKIDSVKLLLDKNARINVKTKTGGTPLILAAGNNFPEIVKLLMDRSIDAKDYLPALDLAVKNGNRDVVAAFAAKIKIGSYTSFNDILLLAAKYGRTEIVKYLLDNGMSVDGRGYDTESGNTTDRFTALMMASQYGQTATVKLLLEQKGVTVYIDDNNEKKDAVMFACEKGYPEIVAMLLEHGAAPRQEDANGWTPLMYAAKSGNVATVKLLLAKIEPKKLNDKNKKGETALDIAITNRRTAVVELLKKVWPK
jgi:ankyrin repeat protein